MLEDTKIWHFCHVQSGAKIGKKCSLGQNVNVSNNVTIGDGCVIGAGTHEELMDTCDEYRTIAQTQMGAGKEAV